MYHESFARVWVVSITTLLEQLDIRSIARVNSKLLLRFLDFKVRRWILILRLLQHCHLVMWACYITCVVRCRAADLWDDQFFGLFLSFERVVFFVVIGGGRGWWVRIYLLWQLMKCFDVLIGRLLSDNLVIVLDYDIFTGWMKLGIAWRCETVACIIQICLLQRLSRFTLKLLWVMIVSKLSDGNFLCFFLLRRGLETPFWITRLLRGQSLPHKFMHRCRRI